ncbi:PREDICTED: heme oxygenase 1 [Papilio xuthus]|uniref:Heme oxygenase n=1 Tax=Papilio xuthus TaxID=66420 RepID=A0A194PXK0_PAPXU|nr:PREDICTED: heme oxygenase 1 [Papilio xuthus]KPI97748.1 Heme oxygenase 1 [Papilio xuthus]
MSENYDLFTTRMRKATRRIHSVSDTLVNAKFALSLRDEAVWGGGLFVFYHIFAFLEDAKDRLNMTDFNKLFVNKILYRKKAFEEDLAHYLGENWQLTPKSAALENYIEHLQDLETEHPMMLLAYVYHLYLGLLSGGQILAKKRKMFGEKNTSENVYADKVTDFNDIDINELKKEFRNAMNEIAERMSKDEQDAFIEESNQVFLMNNLIVNSIGGQNRVLCNMFYKASALLLVVIGVIYAYKMHK